mgnify:FL=1
MKNNNKSPGRDFPGLTAGASLLALLTLLAGCASEPPAAVAQPHTNGTPVVVEDAGPVSALAYYQMLQRMTAAQINRERTVLAALPTSPNTQLRTAMVLGHPRAQLDLTKALSLLDGVLKSTDPAAVSLHPLARLLADNYNERLRLDAQLEKQGQQLKESQRKAVELQEKIDELADIERTLPQRPRATRPSGGAVR